MAKGHRVGTTGLPGCPITTGLPKPPKLHQWCHGYSCVLARPSNLSLGCPITTGLPKPPKLRQWCHGDSCVLAWPSNLSAENPITTGDWAAHAA